MASNPASNPAPPLDEQAERQKRETERWAAVHRQETRLILFAGAFLALSTLYFASVNAYVILHAKPRPFQLSFQQFGSGQLSGSYRASVEWEPLGKGKVVRPEIAVDGVTLPESSQGGAARSQVLSLAQTAAVAISVPPDCTTGRHVGRLALDRVSGPDILPARLETPIDVGVTGGFWSSWFLLRNWLILTILVGSVLYAYCLINFPPPSGRLVIFQSNGPSRMIPLRMRGSARLFPWRRSSLPLRSIWKQAKIQPPSRVEGELMFWASNMPLLIVHWCRTPAEVTFLTMDSSQSADDLGSLETANFKSSGSAHLMTKGVVCKQGVSESHYTLFTWKNK